MREGSQHKRRDNPACMPRLNLCPQLVLHRLNHHIVNQPRLPQVHRQHRVTPPRHAHHRLKRLRIHNLRVIRARPARPLPPPCPPPPEIPANPARPPQSRSPQPAARDIIPSQPSDLPPANTHSVNSSPTHPLRAQSGKPQSPYPGSDRAPSAAQSAPAAHPSARNTHTVAARSQIISVPPWRHPENVPRAICLPAARSIPLHARTWKIPGDKSLPPPVETIHPPSPRSAFPRLLPAGADTATNPHSPQIVWDLKKWKRTPASIPGSPSPTAPSAPRAAPPSAPACPPRPPHQRQVPRVQRPHRRHQPDDPLLLPRRPRPLFHPGKCPNRLHSR